MINETTPTKHLTQVEVRSTSPLVITGLDKKTKLTRRFVATGRWNHAAKNPTVVSSNGFKYCLHNYPELPHLPQKNPKHFNHPKYSKHSMFETTAGGIPCYVLYLTYPAEPEAGIPQAGIDEMLLFDSRGIQTDWLEKKADFDKIAEEIFAQKGDF